MIAGSGRMMTRLSQPSQYSHPVVHLPPPLMRQQKLPIILALALPIWELCLVHLHKEKMMRRRMRLVPPPPAHLASAVAVQAVVY